MEILLRAELPTRFFAKMIVLAPSPSLLLAWLLGAAIGVGGLLQGLHWSRSGAGPNAADLSDELRLARQELAALKRENESLRSLAQGGGEFAVPQELIDRIEQDFKLRFLSSPVVHRIAREELRDRIGAAVESRFGPSGIDDRQEAYRLIGWLDKSHPLLAELTAVLAVGVRGWFDDVTGEGWVTDQLVLENIPDQATLMRLLTRILLHQHFPPPPAYPGDDADRARLALHQGIGLGSEARHYAANARAIGFVPVKQDEEAARTFATLAPFIQGVSLFPATAGKGFADALYLQGNDSLHAALRNPPQSTRAILQPTTPPAAPPPLAMDRPDPADEPFLSETAGQLGLRIWLETAVDASAAAEIASHWVNDRYWLVPDGDAEVALIWDIELNSANAVDLLENAANARIAAMAAKPSAPADSSSVTPSGRQLKCLRISPTKLRFSNSAKPGTGDAPD